MIETPSNHTPSVWSFVMPGDHQSDGIGREGVGIASECEGGISNVEPLRIFLWCRRRDSNPHAISGTGF